MNSLEFVSEFLAVEVNVPAHLVLGKVCLRGVYKANSWILPSINEGAYGIYLFSC